MAVKALEDTLKLVEFVAVQLITAKKTGKPLFDFIQSPEFQALVAQEIVEAPEVMAEALNLSLLDDLMLGRDIYNCVSDIVRAVKAA